MCFSIILHKNLNDIFENKKLDEEIILRYALLLKLFLEKPPISKSVSLAFGAYFTLSNILEMVCESLLHLVHLQILVTIIHLLITVFIFFNKQLPMLILLLFLYILNHNYDFIASHLLVCRLIVPTSC